MRELRFDPELYRGEHVDEAIQVYDRFATIERDREGELFVVRVRASDPERERAIAGELGNYALGLTIRGRS